VMVRVHIFSYVMSLVKPSYLSVIWCSAQVSGIATEVLGVGV